MSMFPTWETFRKEMKEQSAQHILSYSKLFDMVLLEYHCLTEADFSRLHSSKTGKSLDKATLKFF